MDDDDDLRRIEEKLVEVFPGLAAEEACPEPGCVCEGRPEEHEPTGGWSAPTACAAGVCASLGSDPEAHDKGCAMVLSRSALQSGGWLTPSEDVLPLLELPQIQVRRGGIRYPRFAVKVFVTGHKRFLRRKQWRLHVQYVDHGRTFNHYMEFTSEQAAHNAEQIMKFTMQFVNETYHEEKR